MRELNKSKRKLLENYGEAFFNSYKRKNSGKDISLLGTLIANNEFANEANDVVNHKKNSIAFQLKGKSDSLFILVHGNDKGLNEIGNFELTNEDWGYALQLENLIPKDVKNIYTMSCYGALQKPFTLPNGVQVKSFHESQKSISFSDITKNLRQYTPENKKDNKILNKIYKKFNLFKTYSFDGKGVIPELKDFFDKPSHTVNNFLYSQTIDDAITKYLKNGLTKEDLIKIYNPYSRKYFNAMGKALPSNYEEIRKSYINKKVKEHKEIYGEIPNIYERFDKALENQRITNNEVLEIIRKNTNDRISNNIPTNIEQKSQIVFPNPKNTVNKPKPIQSNLEPKTLGSTTQSTKLPQPIQKTNTTQSTKPKSTFGSSMAGRRQGYSAFSTPKKNTSTPTRTQPTPTRSANTTTSTTRRTTPTKPIYTNNVKKKTVPQQINSIPSNNKPVTKTTTKTAKKPETTTKTTPTPIVTTPKNNAKVDVVTPAKREATKTAAQIDTKDITKIAKYVSSSGNRYGKTIGKVVDILV